MAGAGHEPIPANPLRALVAPALWRVTLNLAADLPAALGYGAVIVVLLAAMIAGAVIVVILLPFVVAASLAGRWPRRGPPGAGPGPGWPCWPGRPC